MRLFTKSKKELLNTFVTETSKRLAQGAMGGTLEVQGGRKRVSATVKRRVQSSPTPCKSEVPVTNRGDQGEGLFQRNSSRGGL